MGQCIVMYNGSKSLLICFDNYLKYLKCHWTLSQDQIFRIIYKIGWVEPQSWPEANLTQDPSSFLAELTRFRLWEHWFKQLSDIPDIPFDCLPNLDTQKAFPLFSFFPLSFPFYIDYSYKRNSCLSCKFSIFEGVSI